MFRIARCTLRRVRCYSDMGKKAAGASIGPKFTSEVDIDEFLARSTWDIRDYVPKSIDEDDLPSEETVRDLLKISGLPVSDIKQIQLRLANQLSFINRLHSLPVDESINPNHARIMERYPDPLRYDDLVRGSESQQKSEDLGEVSGSWDATQHAAVKKEGFFIVREGLLKGRK